jgi:hypothetical protein
MTQKAILLLAVVLLLAGCATRVSTKNPVLTIVWGDAYTLDCEDGQAMAVGEDGTIICPNGDSVEVRGGNMGTNMATFLKDIVAIGIGFLPGGSDGHTHTVSDN